VIKLPVIKRGDLSWRIPTSRDPLADVGNVAETATEGMLAWLPLAALVALAAGAWWFLKQ
jgi:hypothetical protein